MNFLAVSQFSADTQTIIYPVRKEELASQLAVIAEQTALPLAVLETEVKAEKAEITTFFSGEKRIYVLGLGSEANSHHLIKAFRTLIFKHKTKVGSQIGISLQNRPADWTEFVVNGIILGTYDFGLYKSDPKTPVALFEQGTVELLSAEVNPELIEKGKSIAETQLQLFTLLNAPSNFKTPQTLASWAMHSGEKYGYKVRVFDSGECHSLGLFALLAVGQGSKSEPEFIVMEYKGEGATQKVGLVGKGVTFDTGGISIKPSENMHLMKSDMGGAAAVLGAVEVAAKLKLPIHLIGIVPTTENSVDGESMKPGDVIQSYAGKTIEVTDTDAEGRLILADGLTYAVRNFKPDVLIDLATLTGSIIRTLGYHAAGLFTTSDLLGKKLKRAGERTGERLWRLPMWEDYADHLKSDIADVRNFSGVPHSQAIAAAKFLELFVENHTAWAHLDIAGTAYGDMDLAPQRAGTAYGVRLLTEFLTQLINDKSQSSIW
ncbi:leucyl aminopeptidase family protein [Siphonobacter sp. SORGH_AS_0500]|uniref:leucyl aminopeptidase family protein n=1 Tax=Siphonobacter sp. SORGH_AS_0500 TaxID=1864824 RepID=UPI002861BE6D|nr:leucyl aminopeptidase family protein [Siphonobacter sp. SORGH_AS_0500]MDR6196571.1 leucyl aminopeptidase [Siphonobacter sp. SORGH_AS_0500]